MRRLFFASSVILLAGCGAATPRADTADARADEQTHARVRQLEEELARRDREAEARAASTRPAATVRIGDRGDAEQAWDGGDPGVPALTDRSEAGPRPVLTLEGTPTVASIEDITRQYGAPSLPVTPLAAAPSMPPPASYALPAPVEPMPLAPAPRRADIAAAAHYRGALVALEARRFEDAAAQLSTFVDAFPEHSLVGNALYWRGEARYALRQYEPALADFERVAREHGDEAKAADALLKAGFCYLRMGDRARAAQYFSRLRREHPRSVAARLASEEGPI